MRILPAILVVLAAVSSVATTRAAPPPIGAYAALPNLSVRLSPDGSALAMIGAVGGKPAFVIVHLDGTPPKVFATGGWTPDWIAWKSPTLLVAGMRTGMGGNERSNPVREVTRLLVLQADGSHPMAVDLTFSHGRATSIPLISDRIVSMMAGDPDHILMATLDGMGTNVSSIDLHTGDKRVAQDSRHDVIGWAADEGGAIRVAEQVRPPSGADGHRGIAYMARVSAADDWHTLMTDRIDGSYGARFAAFDPKDPDRVLFSVAGPAGYRVIQAWHIGAGQPGEIVAQAAGADVLPIVRGRRLLGYLTEGTDQRITYLDPAWQHDALAMSRAIGGGTVMVLDRSADGRHVLAALQDGALPTEYWMLDRTGAKATLHPVLRTYEGVPTDSVAPPRWVSYPARDGLSIPALLTLPVGRAAQGLPFVIMPHGGPHLHDSLGFDWTAQFLASRGYGVLQPQFRASTGFGQALYDAGLHQWGSAVQDDIAEGARYVAAHHLADPARIAIVGASFGGYAALLGAERYPGLYRAAAAWAPVADLPMMVGRMSVFARPEAYIVEAGTSFADLQAGSP